jgi:hypothetical protein
MHKFNNINEFYRHYEAYNGRHITLEDVDRLEEQLITTGYSVKEYKNGIVIVREPDELKAAKERRKTMQANESAKYTKLSAAIPIPLAQAFSSACKALGIPQSDVLIPILNATIERAKQLPHD